MTGKIMGAVLILFGCGGFGFAVCARYRREENSLRKLLTILDYIQCELQYRLTPLPDLCRQAGQQRNEPLFRFFELLADELDAQVLPDVESCIQSVLKSVPQLPEKSVYALRILGRSLGRFDVEGQIRDLDAVREYCRRELKTMAQNRENRLRSYQTLGICAGAALAILLV